MCKREIILLSILTFTVGLLFGFLFSPIKQGIQIGNGCADSIHNHFK